MFCSLSSIFKLVNGFLRTSNFYGANTLFIIKYTHWNSSYTADMSLNLRFDMVLIANEIKHFELKKTAGHLLNSV